VATYTLRASKLPRPSCCPSRNTTSKSPTKATKRTPFSPHSQPLDNLEVPDLVAQSRSEEPQLNRAVNIHCHAASMIPMKKPWYDEDQQQSHRFWSPASMRPLATGRAGFDGSLGQKRFGLSAPAAIEGVEQPLCESCVCNVPGSVALPECRYCSATVHTY
jgi:hypothetical protein